ncbi:hypothetical protein GX51_05617 [Blastomyces parvus]|uniref:Uncharacterized protein n=1 Tax=Blastomyces parvus TaxID=2060905 RepID=A0A2B7WVA4_9EURO|nr:hypothetical protein GX51_05617 [Blastomyces parvus]
MVQPQPRILINCSPTMPNRKRKSSQVTTPNIPTKPGREMYSSSRYQVITKKPGFGASQSGWLCRDLGNEVITTSSSLLVQITTKAPVWDLLAGGQLLYALKNRILNDEQHLAEMVAFRGPPPQSCF